MIRFSQKSTRTCQRAPPRRQYHSCQQLNPKSAQPGPCTAPRGNDLGMNGPKSPREDDTRWRLPNEELVAATPTRRRHPFVYNRSGSKLLTPTRLTHSYLLVSAGSYQLAPTNFTYQKVSYQHLCAHKGRTVT